jgi:excisionase family DNA binding protein
MAEPQYVSTSQVAAALGVSVTTVKRWVDENILPARRTAGGHRKLLLADVLRIVREENFPHADLSRLQAVRLQEAPPAPEALAADLHGALRAGDLGSARTLIQAAFQAGMAIEALADAVVAPAMRQFGTDWEKGRIDVLHEHRGTQVCAAALYELRAGLEGRPGRYRPVALGAAPEGDPSLLPTLLAQMVLLDGGWDAINFGPHTPLASLRKALVEFRPRLLWLSVSHAICVEAFLADYRELYREAQRAGTAVAVGGRVLTAEVRANMPYTTFGEGLTHLAAFARSLHPRPRRPRRGRPRRAP